MTAGGSPVLDRVSALAAECLSVPVCLVSLVCEERETFPGASGLPASWASGRESHPAYSPGRQVVLRGGPLAVNGAEDLSGVGEVGAFLGIPIATSDGLLLGAFCAIDTKPREWTDEEVSRMRDFTALVTDQVEGHLAKARAGKALDVVIHDLKTPLAGITMAGSLLHERKGEMPEALHPLLEILTESTEKALGLVKKLSSRQSP